ncbi:hypothetical protein AVEN_180841-1 [Araneus ventricosus]|uniref:Uncharacterized protein n=1 Tax=Araneus ventricosus TaxID=182803 RepID=A0A4Y2TYB8_ARAVE|nr:hypothetical protein AVEN_180841-1 [Araneus ventricosus]
MKFKRTGSIADAIRSRKPKTVTDESTEDPDHFLLLGPLKATVYETVDNRPGPKNLHHPANVREMPGNFEIVCQFIRHPVRCA